MQASLDLPPYMGTHGASSLGSTPLRDIPHSKTADSAQPRKCSNVTRPFSSLEDGVWVRDYHVPKGQLPSCHMIFDLLTLFLNMLTKIGV